MQRYTRSQDYIMKLETDVRRMKLDLESYKAFLSGIHENLLLDNDRLTEKKAREIKSTGYSLHSDGQLQAKIEELEHSIKTANLFNYTFPEDSQTKHLKIDLFESPRSPTMSE